MVSKWYRKMTSAEFIAFIPVFVWVQVPSSALIKKGSKSSIY